MPPPCATRSSRRLRAVVADPTVAELRLDGAGAVVLKRSSTSTSSAPSPDPATATLVRMTAQPDHRGERGVRRRTAVMVHGACISAGMELVAHLRAE